MEEIKRVYVAEADASHREYLIDLVGQDAGFDVVGAGESGSEALRAVESHHPDILLLALALKEIDGLNVLDRLCQMALTHYPRIAVITAMPEPRRQQALELGADACMGKPLDEARFWKWMRLGNQTPIISEASLPARRALASQVMDEMGMSRSLAGFVYLAEAVAMASCDQRLTRHMMDELYPRVAVRFETTVPRVERAIRRVVEDNWVNGRIHVAHMLFGYSVDPQRGKPTNGECIARLAEYVHFAMAGGRDEVHLIGK